MTHKKKLIEVALPHDAINAGSAREKSIRHGHPSTLHLWWARRPLAAARAVIFAQMVDDPSAHPDLFPTEKKQEMVRSVSLAPLPEKALRPQHRPFLGMALAAGSRFAEAETQFNKVLRLNPANDGARRGLAMLGKRQTR